MPLQRLRLLHISDLHDRGTRETEAWRRRRVLADSWEENLAELLQDGPIDLVCFTGDAADWGKPEEFEAAAEFLKAVCDRVRVPHERLFVVPGNHDVDRSIEPDTWSAVRSAVERVEPLGLARWLHGRELPPGFQPEWRTRLFDRFGAYRQWVHSSLGRPEVLAGHAADGPHSYRISLKLRDLPIHVIGLDSAWLCGDDSDAGRLRLTDEQVMAQLTDRGQSLEGFRLVLVHHPLDDLHSADRETVRARLADHADLVLRGHLHSPEISTWADPDHRLRQLAAGCLYEGHRADQYPNGCQVITLELEGAAGASAAEIRLRSFSPRGGHWYDDGSLYKEARNGRFRFALAPRRSTPGSGGRNPFDPFHPAVPPGFVGRRLELLQLEDSLTDRNGVSLVGDWRIGKTSLLRAWELKAIELGRTAVFLDGQGAEGASIAAFVGKIIGRPAPETADSAADALAAWLRTHPEGLTPVLLIDEFDGLAPRFDLRFFERLRPMLDYLPLAIASRRPIDLLYLELEKTSPFHNRLKTLYLGLVEPEAAEEITALGSELAAEDKGLMRLWAGCHPFHLQLLGHCLIEARRLGATRDWGLENYLDNAFGRLRELWARLEEKEQSALRSLSQGQPTTLRSLRRRGLVDESGQAFGEVLVAWLQEET